MAEPPGLGEAGTLVSVVIPVFNGERYLAEAIDSALGQTVKPAEVIVADDGSTDGTAQVATSYGSLVRYSYEAQRGSGAARNRGVAMARGEFIAFLDADDLWTPEKLDRQLSVFNTDSDVDIVYAHVKQFHSPELSEDVRQQIRCPDEAAPGHMPGTTLVRRDTFLRVGPFAEHWGVGEGVDWHMRATDLGLKMIMLPDVLLWRRLHENNLGRRQRDSRADYVRIMKAALDRRRRAAGQPGGDAQPTS